MDKVVSFMRFSEGGCDETQPPKEPRFPSLVSYRGERIITPIRSLGGNRKGPTLNNPSRSEPGKTPVPAA